MQDRVKDLCRYIQPSMYTVTRPPYWLPAVLISDCSKVCAKREPGLLSAIACSQAEQ